MTPHSTGEITKPSLKKSLAAMTFPGVGDRVKSSCTTPRTQAAQLLKRQGLPLLLARNVPEIVERACFPPIENPGFDESASCVCHAEDIQSEVGVWRLTTGRVGLSIPAANQADPPVL